MRNIRLVLAYDGAAYQGFQRLKSGRSVQGELERAWRDLTGEAARTVVAGRTDAGVHALGQVVSFRTGAGIPVNRAATALNGRLPGSIRIRTAVEVDHAFHARFSATARTYQYFVRRRGRPSVVYDRFSLFAPGELNVPAMRRTGALLIGSHDFRSFGSPEPGKHGVRCLRSVRFKEWRGWLIVSITANAFLTGMARCLMTQFLEVGRGGATPDEIESRLKACDRNVAGKPAPPNGLFLARVEYDRSWLVPTGALEGRSAEAGNLERR
ncbi:MAG TPA: tRNA pseudouridine(38-40) synthase TruA [Armatimonadota bacterium]|jgi:tRNA pseudouridine38-40 synthase